jgi:hypothetical protein
VRFSVQATTDMAFLALALLAMLLATAQWGTVERRARLRRVGSPVEA